MNTYHKLMPHVFLAKCEEQYNPGDEIVVTTRRGKENECIVHNFIYEKDGYYFYSITRADGWNAQERAKAKAERYGAWAGKAEEKADERREASNEGRDFLKLAEPIKIGHHSEKRHRALIERNHRRMEKAMELYDKAKEHQHKAEYWASRADEINLGMPESLEYYKYELEKAEARHAGLKDGSIEREHSYSLTYAKKKVNELKKKVENAEILWG